MADILQQLQVQMAEFKALKEYYIASGSGPTSGPSTLRSVPSASTTPLMAPVASHPPSDAGGDGQ
jgi:hypothetical protein